MSSTTYLRANEPIIDRHDQLSRAPASPRACRLDQEQLSQVCGGSDAREPGLPGVTIYADLNNNAAADYGSDYKYVPVRRM